MRTTKASRAKTAREVHTSSGALQAFYQPGKRYFKKLDKGVSNIFLRDTKTEVIYNGTAAWKLFRQHIRPDWINYVPQTSVIYVNAYLQPLGCFIEQSFCEALTPSYKNVIIGRALALGASGIIVGKNNIYGSKLEEDERIEEDHDAITELEIIGCGLSELEAEIEDSKIEIVDMIAINSEGYVPLYNLRDVSYFAHNFKTYNAVE